MTVSSTTNKTQANGNGSTSAFPFTFKFTAKAEISVIVTSSAGVDSTKTLDTHYTLTDPADNGGTVTFLSSPTDHRPQSGEVVTITRTQAVTQIFDPTAGGGLSSSTVEATFDKSVMLIQQTLEQVGRAPKLKTTSTSTTPTFPEPEAGKIIAWNSDGDDLENIDSPTDAVADAAASAAAAATSESNAASSASAASTSASNASTSATAAQTAETNAETAETNAETAQAAAEAAQTAAEAAQAAAEAASENPAFTYAFDSSTSDADPGAGEFRLNNGTLASVTTIYIDNADSDGNTITGYLDSFDDIGDTNRRGHLIIKGIDTPTAFFVGLVTGSVTDGTGYRKVTVTHVTSGGTFTAGENFSVLFAAVGPTGTGDVSGPASATGGNIAVFDDNTGKLIADGGISIANILTEAEASAAYQPLDADLTAWAGVATSAKANSALTLTAGSGLTGGGTLASDRTFAVGASTGIVVNADDVAVDKATDANVRAAVSNKVITADLIESASAGVALTDAATVAVDWDAGINFTLTVTANRAIGNPTNGQPGTWRTILVQGNDATDRTITFGNQYLGDVPTITDCDSGRWYLLMIFCVSSTHFVVSSKKANGT